MDSLFFQIIYQSRILVMMLFRNFMAIYVRGEQKFYAQKRRLPFLFSSEKAKEKSKIRERRKDEFVWPSAS